MELTLREGDADASRLARRLAGALDIGNVDMESSSLALDIVDHVAARSPAAICLHLDDVHRLDADSTGGQLLREVIDERPGNLTFVLSTRGDLPLPLARRAATGDLVLIDGDTEMFFDPDELASLGYRPDERTGWPVLVALDAVESSGVRTSDFLFEEIASALPAAVRSALDLVAGTGRLPVEVVAARYGHNVVDALVHLPLIERNNDDVLVAHDLWADALRDGDADLDALIDVLLDDEHFDRALAMASEAHDEAAIERVLLAAATHHAPTFPVDTARRWLGVLDAPLHHGNGALMMQAAAGITPSEEALVTLDRFAQEWTAPEDAPARHAAFAIAANRAYSADRLDRVLEIRGELDRLPAPLPPFLAAVRAGVDAVLADLVGDAEGAVAQLAAIDFDAVPPLLAEQLLRLYATNHVALGRAGDAVPVVERLLAGSSRPQVAMTPHMLRWFSGNPAPIRAFEDADLEPGLDGPDLVISRGFRTHLRAAVRLELTDDCFTPEVLEVAGGIARLRTIGLVARAAADVAAGNEAAAAASLANDLQVMNTDDPVVVQELWRFLPVAAVLVPDVVDLAAAAGSGPTHRRMAELSRLLLDAREGGDAIAVAPAPTTGDLITAFPLRWTMEFVAHARSLEVGWATSLAAEVMDEVGPDARHVLAELAGRAGDVGGGARSLLDETPNPPGDILQVHVLGPLRLLRDDQEVDDALLRRSRVRQLVAMLATHDWLRREELIDLLWPDASAESGAKNLRTNLSHVRRLLEPEISSGAPSYFVRTSGDRIRLGGASLRCDLTDFEEHLARATVADDRGDLATALEGYERAAALWRGLPVVDLMDVAGMEALQASIQRRAAFAASRAAEIRLARKDISEAVTLAERALAIAPYGEAGHRVRLAALVAGADVVGVRRAVDALESDRREGLVAVDDETGMVLRRAHDLLDRSAQTQEPGR